MLVTKDSMVNEQLIHFNVFKYLGPGVTINNKISEEINRRINLTNRTRTPKTIPF